MIITKEKQEQFIEAVIALSKGFGLSISHEDKHGDFTIEAYNETYSEWLSNAGIDEINIADETTDTNPFGQQ